jgi:hypothetical protein
VILSQMELHLSTNGIIEEVFELIDDIMKTLKAEHTQREELWGEQSASCKTSLKSYSDKIIKSSSDVKFAQETQVSTAKMTVTAEQALTEAISEISRLSKALVAGRNTRS